MNSKQIATFVLIFFLSMCLIYIYKQKPQNKFLIEEKNTPIVYDEPKESSLEDAINSITKDELKTYVEYLASDELEGRMSGKKGNITAAEFIKKKYDEWGYTTEYQKFNIRRVNNGPNNERGDDFTQNVFAYIKGKNENEIVVIGAHMDHIGYGPSYSRSRKIAIHNGADDNASGTAGLLEIAQAFSMVKDKLKRSVLIQSYSAEEMGLIGSEYYCDHPTYPKNNPNMKNHIFMLNLDMIGYLKNQRKSIYNETNSIELEKYVNILSKKYSFAESITSLGGSSGSDHASFYNKKIPIAFLHTGLHDVYHTPEDDANLIDYDGMEAVSRYAFELAWSVIQSDSVVKLNLSMFKEMDVTLDHSAIKFNEYK